MADYISSARTNYFKVKDEEAFRDFAVDHDFEVIEQKGLFGLIGELFNVTDDDGEALDVDDLIRPHLAPGEVCVAITVGQENMRYLSGCAVAFDSTDRVVEVSLLDIYAQAEKLFGVLPTKAEY